MYFKNIDFYLFFFRILCLDNNTQYTIFMRDKINLNNNVQINTEINSLKVTILFE